MKTIKIIKNILIIIGAIAAYYMVSLQVQYGVTTKIISEMISPKLHPEAMEKVYMPMTNILLDTHDWSSIKAMRQGK
jgi:3-hydroxyisobutyrate dehydrogenase-like beta-hydroxyacid dehydrogenase